MEMSSNRIESWLSKGIITSAESVGNQQRIAIMSFPEINRIQTMLKIS
jgi:hypothetical protein